MHAETLTFGMFVRGYPDGEVPYKEMCVYNGIRWAAYISAQNHNDYADPGFRFSVILN